ncbi:MAG: hydrogenase iron-sulfur subunit [Burkholderiales bacterium]|nr:hydrogenase iron-sulfur subunit [Burkholderiales bacterium]HNQ57226.1 hydrogenase iron-sulfur subunit [Candidatus Desulfobacillus denitrificans]HNT61472.1 hydrogenase iron-sulfur subunit [Candidatus Desulfobacillus denitrificans]
MSPIASIRQGGLALMQRIESFFDEIFGAAANPWRHLGALGFYFLWIALATGIYLFIVLDTGIEEIHASIEYYTHEQWWLGGIVRSLHRYAADGLVLVMLLHILREFLYGRFHGFRWYSWITGVPTLWLVYASGIGGYWLVWDQLGLFSAIASAEWFDWLPIFNTPATRNFLPGVLTDRFFTLLVFLHIGIPLLLLLALWVHIQRVSQSDVFPARSLALGTLAMLLVLALAKPTVSHGKADLTMFSPVLHIDWYYLFIHPLMYATSPGGLWAIAGALTLLLLILPLLPHPRQGPVAVVDPPNCNGCRRCFVDCPYGAITMLPHPDKPGHELARVHPELCASCGICAGACPSSTPFRSMDKLVTGIDMPQQPVGALRAEMERKIAALRGQVKIAVFGCECAAASSRLESGDTAVLNLMCSGLLPPSFVEYALRGGADGVLVTGCREGSCAYRFGTRWTEERLNGRREPHLRPSVPAERLRLDWADRHEMSHLKATLDDFRQHLQTLGADEKRPRAYTPRRIVQHG